MHIDDAIKGRRSIRSFREDDIPDSTLAELFDLTRRAPSSMNGQPWHFVVVRSAASKAKLSEIKNRYCPPEKRSFTADFIQKAPVIVVVCVDRGRSFGREVENGVLAAATLMLAAHSRGLGSVYLSAYASEAPGLSEEIRSVLGIPEGTAPITMLPLGWPAEAPAHKDLVSLEKMIHFEQF